MVRCGCASDQCSCSIIAGDGVVVSGTGSKNNPYVVQGWSKKLSGYEVRSDRAIRFRDASLSK